MGSGEKLDAEDRQIIEACISGNCSSDEDERERWRRELIDATRSGWFCPTDPEELRIAIECLKRGEGVPDFPRTG